MTNNQRDAFEAWANGRCELHLVNSAGIYSSAITQFAFEAYQAGRAALQSQDREDAVRYRWLRDNAQLFSHFGEEGNSGWCVMRRDSAITRVFTYNHAELDEAIDHARRIEGDEE
jgi:hypothetical protein